MLSPVPALLNLPTGFAVQHRSTPIPPLSYASFYSGFTRHSTPTPVRDLDFHFFERRLGRGNGVQSFDHGIGKFRGPGGAADVAGEVLPFAVDFLNRQANVVGGVLLAEVAQHENARAQHRRGIGEIFTGDVGRGAVYSFEDGALVTKVRSRHQAQPADKGRAQVGDDVAVEIFQQQYVVLIGIHDELHAGVVHDVLAVGDLGIAFGNQA